MDVALSLGREKASEGRAGSQTGCGHGWGTGPGCGLVGGGPAQADLRCPI